MNDGDGTIRWQRFDSPKEVAAQAAQYILDAAKQSIAEHGAFRLVLAGGGTPKAAYRLLTDSATNWNQWHVFFGDERCLPVDSPDRNSVMAYEAFLSSVPIPVSNINVIPAELGPEAAAQSYENVVRAVLPFDLVLLGVGEDGHTASLFPGHQHPAERLVVAVHNAPKPPSDRVSLTSAALNAAQRVLILATGENKRAAIDALRAAYPLPIGEISGRAGVDIFTDIRESD